MKKKSKNQVYIPHQDKWNEHFPTPGKPNPNYYTDSGATFNKHLRTQNKQKTHIHNPTRPTDNPIRDLNPKNTKLLTHQTKTNIKINTKAQYEQ